MTNPSLWHFLQERAVVDKTMKEIVELATQHHTEVSAVMGERRKIRRWGCYEEVLDMVDEQCDHLLNIPEVCNSFVFSFNTSVTDTYGIWVNKNPQA